MKKETLLTYNADELFSSTSNEIAAHRNIESNLYL